jgi:hypothetical protein
MIAEFREKLASSLILFSCEGKAEHIILSKLRQEKRLLCPNESIVDLTLLRGATSIAHGYLGLDYDQQLILVRVLDSRSERFELNRLYRERFPVFSIYTHPEIEMLAIIKEGQLAEYDKVKSRVKPSQFCKETLGMKRIKDSAFLDTYWNADELSEAIREYRRPFPQRATSLLASRRSSAEMSLKVSLKALGMTTVPPVSRTLS